MGFTHYWRGQRVITDAALADIKTIIETSGIPITGAYGVEGTEPILTDDLISFNGVGDDAYETLYISTVEDGFGCCKTARKLYDPVVCATLLRIKEDSPDFKIASDGEWDAADEWGAGRDLFEAALWRESTGTLDND